MLIHYPLRERLPLDERKIAFDLFERSRMSGGITRLHDIFQRFLCRHLSARNGICSVDEGGLHAAIFHPLIGDVRKTMNAVCGSKNVLIDPYAIKIDSQMVRQSPKEPSEA